MKCWIGADSGKQRVRQRASRANRSCFTFTWQGDADKLTDSDEQAEGQCNGCLNQTLGGSDCNRSRDECSSRREQDRRDR
jgi:hypothetical protein